MKIWSGKRDSNSRPRPWQGRALPTELFPHNLRILVCYCVGCLHSPRSLTHVSSQGFVQLPPCCKLKYSILTLRIFVTTITLTTKSVIWMVYYKLWSGKRDSNSRPRPWQGRALPTELFPHNLRLFIYCCVGCLHSHRSLTDVSSCDSFSCRLASNKHARF